MATKTTAANGKKESKAAGKSAAGEKAGATAAAKKGQDHKPRGQQRRQIRCSRFPPAQRPLPETGAKTW